MVMSERLGRITPRTTKDDVDYGDIASGKGFLSKRGKTQEVYKGLEVPRNRVSTSFNPLPQYQTLKHFKTQENQFLPPNQTPNNKHL